MTVKELIAQLSQYDADLEVQLAMCPACIASGK